MVLIYLGVGRNLWCLNFTVDLSKWTRLRTTMNILSFVNVSLWPYLDVDNHFLEAVVKYLNLGLISSWQQHCGCCPLPLALHRALNPFWSAATMSHWFLSNKWSSNITQAVCILIFISSFRNIVKRLSRHCYKIWRLKRVREHEVTTAFPPCDQISQGFPFPVFSIKTNKGNLSFCCWVDRLASDTD